MWFSLRLFGYDKTSSWFLTVPETAAGEGCDDSVDEVLWAVDTAVRYHFLPIRCLVRTIVLGHLLARVGVNSERRFGVLRQDDTILAHAWVEVEGRPLGEQKNDLDAFRILKRPPSELCKRS